MTPVFAASPRVYDQPARSSDNSIVTFVGNMQANARSAALRPHAERTSHLSFRCRATSTSVPALGRLAAVNSSGHSVRPQDDVLAPSPARLQRREALLAGICAAAASALLPVSSAFADDASPASTSAPSLTTYTDPVDKFTLSVPSDWISGSGEIGGNKGYMGATGAP